MTFGVACLLGHVFLDPPYIRQTASTPNRRLKEVRSRNKSAHPIIVGYVGALYTSIVLGNHPVPVKQTENLFFFESHVRQDVTKRKLADGLRDLGFTVSQTEDQSSRVCSPRGNQVRSTLAGFSLIKASFQESKQDDDSFNRMSASPHGSAAR